MAQNLDKVQLHRQEWKEKTLRKSMRFFFVYTVYSQIIFVVLLFLGIFTINILSRTDLFLSSLPPIQGIFMMLVFLIDLLFVLYTYLDVINFYYILKAGEYQFVRDIIDTKAGVIIIKRGIIIKNQKMVPISQFHKTQLYRGIFGNIFGYGTIIILDEKDKPQLRITNIDNPETHVHDIQNMIANYKGMKMLDPNFGEMMQSGDDNNPRPINRPPRNP